MGASETLGLFGRASRPTNVSVRTNGRPTHDISEEKKIQNMLRIFFRYIVKGRSTLGTSSMEDDYRLTEKQQRNRTKDSLFRRRKVSSYLFYLTNPVPCNLAPYYATFQAAKAAMFPVPRFKQKKKHVSSRKKTTFQAEKKPRFQYPIKPRFRCTSRGHVSVVSFTFRVSYKSF